MSYCQPEDYSSGDNNAIDMVPRWFEMLKELRNGTISYIQLIKREQIRPPVRPVCRRLGVAKLSDIVSEDILYRAIVQVAESQSQGGGRAPRQDDCNESESSSSGSSGLGVDMNSNFHRQGQYPSHFVGNNGWNYPQGQQQNQQHSQRLQRHASDGPLPRGQNNINGHSGQNNRMELQQGHSKSAYDRQVRSSYHGATQQYGTYADLENEMNYMRRQDNHLDNYGGEREVQGFGQQLFSGQSGTQNGSDNVNFHNSYESQRPYSRSETAFPLKPATLGNKAFTVNNRMMQNISGNSDPNVPSLPVRSLNPSNSTDALNYSPQNSPRTPRLGNFNSSGAGNASILGSAPSRGVLNPYSYTGQQVQVLGQGQGQQQQLSGQADQRLLAERDLNIASRPYTSNAHSNVAAIQRSAYGNISSLVGTNNSTGSTNQGPLVSAKHTNQTNTAGQYTASLPSPRTTSFMPFGSLNSCATRGLGDFGEFSVGAAGSDFGGSDGFSQQSTDEQASLGDQSGADYYFKGDYTSSMLDPIHISREQNIDNIESTLESNIDSDVSIYGYGNRFSYPPKPWESL